MEIWCKQTYCVASFINGSTQNYAVYIVLENNNKWVLLVYVFIMLFIIILEYILSAYKKKFAPYALCLLCLLII